MNTEVGLRTFVSISCVIFGCLLITMILYVVLLW